MYHLSYMDELIDLWWCWLTGVEKGVKNYSHGLGRNLKELAVKTLTFCHIEATSSRGKHCRPTTVVGTANYV